MELSHVTADWRFEGCTLKVLILRLLSIQEREGGEAYTEHAGAKGEAKVWKLFMQKRNSVSFHPFSCSHRCKSGYCCCYACCYAVRKSGALLWRGLHLMEEGSPLQVSAPTQPKLLDVVGNRCKSCFIGTHIWYCILQIVCTQTLSLEVFQKGRE